MKPLVYLAAALLVPAAMTAQSPAPTGAEPGAAQLAIATLPASGSARLTVSSPGFQPGGDLARDNTQYGKNLFPGLTWNAGPSGTKAYVMIMQDPDAMMRGNPIFHWSVVNIPAGTTKLDAALTAPPTGAQFGPNMRGANQPYMGPRTPAGPKHRYHFQVFALDMTLPDAAGASYDALTGAMKGHVLASGETIGLGQIWN